MGSSSFLSTGRAVSEPLIRDFPFFLAEVTNMIVLMSGWWADFPRLKLNLELPATTTKWHIVGHTL